MLCNAADALDLDSGSARIEDDILSSDEDKVLEVRVVEVSEVLSPCRS